MNRWLVFSLVFMYLTFGFVFIPPGEAISKKDLDTRIASIELDLQDHIISQKEQQEKVAELLAKNKKWLEQSKKAQQKYKDLKEKYVFLEKKHFEVLEQLSEIDSKVKLLAEASRLENQIESLSDIGKTSMDEKE